MPTSTKKLTLLSNQTQNKTRWLDGWMVTMTIFLFCQFSVAFQPRVSFLHGCRSNLRYLGNRYHPTVVLLKRPTLDINSLKPIWVTPHGNLRSLCLVGSRRPRIHVDQEEGLALCPWQMMDSWPKMAASKSPRLSLKDVNEVKESKLEQLSYCKSTNSSHGSKASDHDETWQNYCNFQIQRNCDRAQEATVRQMRCARDPRGLVEQLSLEIQHGVLFSQNLRY